jgi:HEAT repeat protein
LFARGNPALVKPYAKDFIAALDDENEVIKTNATYILGHIGKEDAELVKEIIPRLIESLKNDPILKENAAYALALIGINNPDLIKDAIPLLLGLLRDSREEVRATSACALGATCNPEALKSLKDLIDDGSLVNVYHPEGRVFVATTVSEMARQAAAKERKRK